MTDITVYHQRRQQLAANSGLGNKSKGVGGKKAITSAIPRQTTPARLAGVGNKTSLTTPSKYASTGSLSASRSKVVNSSATVANKNKTQPVSGCHHDAAVVSTCSLAKAAD